MQNRLKIKLFTLLFLFIFTCCFVYGYRQPDPTTIKAPLHSYFKQIGEYVAFNKITLDNEAYKMLDLDDYLYAEYQAGNSKINLYIGYYYTSDKAYSSHSPLICYPSQGWKIENKPKVIVLKVPPHRIQCEEIITTYGQKKELVLYWYQAGLFTNTQVYKNKIDMGFNKLFNNTQEHGFIRVSIPFADDTYVDKKKFVVDFIQSFYPKFINFIEPEYSHRHQQGRKG
jgi:EpsI family protein